LKQGLQNSNLLLNAKERNLEKVIWCTVKKGVNFNEFKMGRLQKLQVVAMWNWGTISAFGSS
jgi:hypothetical protein